MIEGHPVILSFVAVLTPRSQPNEVVKPMVKAVLRVFICWFI